MSVLDDSLAATLHSLWKINVLDVLDVCGDVLMTTLHGGDILDVFGQ
jgi:hypothetical protein